MKALLPAVASVSLIALVCGFAIAQQSPTTPSAGKPKLYNSAKQKLMDGKQIFSFTQSKFDPKAYCEAAKHYDYTWFEMQHSTLEFRDVEAMIAACPKVAATPMIRFPDAQEWHIQHATDIGALGVIIPTVDDIDRARRGEVGDLSSPGTPQCRFWPSYDDVEFRRTYRKTINDNMLVTVMIESPTGVANAFDIASVPGIDVVIIGNNDLSSFSGYAQGDDKYEELMLKVHDDVLRAGKIFGQANAARYAKGHVLSKDAKFFQNGPSNDGWVPPGLDLNAPPPGEKP